MKCVFLKKNEKLVVKSLLQLFLHKGNDDQDQDQDDDEDKKKIVNLYSC